ncbi:hypothetical protein GLOIN_2v1478891 [Rhizophagus clarus]|uniref:Uncharacterized protein n=1 Tax=Rhizophagus clarus TaxID=94130 RepID=A0A8H3QQC7_9GLOM|nr:hypothetical protein GLOIN_2v1478891 [Rhizophagus clarus]
MVENFQRVCEDLSNIGQVNIELMGPPYNETMDDKSKISITYKCLLRAQRLKQRKTALTYAFYLGKLIESCPIIQKLAKKDISDHYYQTAIRTYYIFEINSFQIMGTQEITLSMIRRLTSQQYHSLIIEI